MNKTQTLQTRFTAFASAAFLTLAMLISVNVMATSEHHDLRLVQAQPAPTAQA